MKKKAVFFIFFILLSSIARADDGENGGILPTSSLWSLDLAIERVVIFLTPGTEAKIQKELDFAEERNKELAEIGIDADEQVVNEVETEITKNLDHAEKLGADISDLAKQKEFADLVSVARQHHLDVLEKVKLQVPDKAKAQIQKVLDRKMNVPEMRVGY